MKSEENNMRTLAFIRSIVGALIGLSLLAIPLSGQITSSARVGWKNTDLVTSDLQVNGDVTVDGYTSLQSVTVASSLVVGDDFTMDSGNIIYSNSSGSSFDILSGTDDGSDNQRALISGGGMPSTSRGAFIDVNGNEHANKGMVRIVAGDGDGGANKGVIQLHTGGILNFELDANGDINIPNGGIYGLDSINTTGPLTAGGYTSLQGVSADSIVADSIVTRALVVNGVEIRALIADSLVEVRAAYEAGIDSTMDTVVVNQSLIADLETGIDSTQDTVVVNQGLIAALPFINFGIADSTVDMEKGINGSWAKAGEALEFGDIVFFDTDATWKKADADTSSGSGTFFSKRGMGFVTADISNGSTGTIMLRGAAKAAGWNFAIVGGDVYLSTTEGEMVQFDNVDSTAGHVLQIIGWAPDPDFVIFNFDRPWSSK